MKNLYIGPCDLRVKKDVLERLTNDIYMKHYKKERLRHVSRNDKRLPAIKVTSDIFSIAIYFKDKSGKELKLYLDGTIFLSDLFISSITMEEEEFNNSEYESILSILISITQKMDGYILYANNSKAGRIKNGILESDKALMKEIYEVSPENRTPESEETFKWMFMYEPEN